VIREADANAIDSWTIFFDPKFKGRWGFPAISWGVGTQVMILAMTQGTGTIESGKPHDVESVWDMVPRLKEQVAVWFSSDDQAGQLIKSGEVPIIGVRSSQEAPNFQQQGLPVNAILSMKEGMIGPGDSATIVKTGDGARENMAAEFINFCLAPEQQAGMSKFFFTPVNKKTKIPPEAEGKVLTTEQVASLKHIDRVWISTQYDGWVERWNKIIAS
jgi:spermidine/putrescine-binding protein